MQLIKLTFHQNLHERNFINVEDLNSFKISLKKHYFKKYTQCLLIEVLLDLPDWSIWFFNYPGNYVNASDDAVTM